MNIVVLTGSPHKTGTSNTLVNEFIRGAEENGHTMKRRVVLFCFLRILQQI